MELHELTALELGRLIASRQVSAPEAARAAFARISRYEKKLNAFITVDEENAMHQAADIQCRIDGGEKLSQLAGVPFAVKDNISTKGTRTTCASRMLWNYTPPFDATVIARMRAAGAVILGKTNLDEFAMGCTTETSFAGPARNPWATDHVPGGSSGGSAAAVASGEAAAALGSDTGGSIRQPCAFCGLTGLKPTYGAVSRYGLIAYASSLDQIGPVGKTASDCAAILSTFAGPDPMDSTCMPAGKNLNMSTLLRATSEPADLRGLKIGVPDEYFTAGLQEESRQAILAAASQLAALGAELDRISLPLVDEAIPAYYLIATAEASANLARYDGIQYGFRPETGDCRDLDDYYRKARTAGFGREVRRRILLGTFALSSGYYDAYYLKALKVRRMISDSLQNALGRFDLILAPVSPSTAPRLGENADDPLKMYLGDIYTVPASLAGLPALALPCGLDGGGLPVGFQLIGRAFDDARLLAAGHAFQLATRHHLERPGLQEAAGSGSHADKEAE